MTQQTNANANANVDNGAYLFPAPTHREMLTAHDYATYYAQLGNESLERLKNAMRNEELSRIRKALYFFIMLDEETWNLSSKLFQIKRNDDTEYEYDLQYYPENYLPCGACVVLGNIKIIPTNANDSNYDIYHRDDCPEDEREKAYKLLLDAIDLTASGDLVENEHDIFCAIEEHDTDFFAQLPAQDDFVANGDDDIYRYVVGRLHD